MKGQRKLVTGPILILVGVLLLLGQSIHWHAFSFFWLLALLAGGVVLLVVYVQGRRHPAFLSAGVLVTLLTLHFFALRWGWVDFNSSWPFFLLAPGLAFLAVAAADRQNKDALAPAITLISIAVICYFFTLGILAWILRFILGILRFLVRYLLPLGLVAWGILQLVERREESYLAADSEEDSVPPAPGVTETVQVEEVEAEVGEMEIEDAVESAEAQVEEVETEPAELEESPSEPAEDGDEEPRGGV